MPQELIQVNARSRPTRIVLVLLLAIATLWSYYVFRWYLGNTMAEYFNTSENNLDLAKIAKNLAPSDPLTSWRLAQVSQKRLPLEQASVALAEYERAVSLSPSDYRFWMSLGVAREQAGEMASAEPALRQAVALAPSYAYPHWYLGNLLLRSGRYDEAFIELRKAGDAAPDELRPQMFNLVLQIYASDFEAMRKAIGENAETRAKFSLYLLNQKKVDEGIAIWETLSVTEKRENKESGEALIQTLVGIPRFHDALKAWNDLEATTGFRAELGHIYDGSLEETIGYRPDTIFGWQVKGSSQVEIGIDPNVSHSGARSLRYAFLVRNQLDAVLTTQLVPVEPNTTYDFECFVRTSKLQTGGPPLVQIVDANSGAQLVASDAAPTGDNDWTRISLSFKTSDKTEAITLKIARASCGEDKICPIFGTVWYDDFSLNRHN